jgi:hypothetical protein
MERLENKIISIIKKDPKLYTDYLNDVFNSLSKSYKKYKDKYYDISYKINLSNGDILKFSFDNIVISHLFGLDMNAIRKEKYFDLANFSAIEILIYIINNKEKVIRSLVEQKISSSIFDYEKIKLKCNGFVDMNQVNFNNINYIVKYDINKTPINGSDSKCDVDYIVCISAKNDNNIYLGLKKNDKIDSYYAKTLFVNMDCNHYLKNQILVLPNSITYKDETWNTKEEILSDINKLKLLNKYIRIAKEQDMNIDVSKEYSELLKLKLSINEVKEANYYLESHNKALINECNLIKEGKKITEEKNQLLIEKEIDYKQIIESLKEENEQLKTTQSKVKVFFKKYLK